ncbi:deleted in malignant brain tumors 1 protein-like isoform X2 [Dendronephthya gigantea]|uniref:deleted in malignant brain tumors 1 protein-like isoform X2 n=1 Tax=Dendronephthya gigantea TaxID=151771 RepID=UPI0010691233|nr:deleted in malignant brain tumors 1 protein-like isoform X2 [Dendronephthya gigantea]
MASDIILNCVLGGLILVSCQCQAMTASLRLRGPLSENGTGRVEVFYNGTWGTICDDGWDINDARVACRQLGYEEAVRPLNADAWQVPSGSGNIWLGHVDCTGKEESLANCSHAGWDHNAYCNHLEDAGVECRTVRLQGPSSANGTGRVEVFYNGQWGTICDDGWDMRDAKVVCRQLGYQDAFKSLDEIPSGSGPIWLDNVDCTGGEESLEKCPHSEWGSHDCTHSEDVGVECRTAGESLPLRLQGPLSVNGTGRVEVFYNGIWGTICDDGWSMEDARVACRQLGYSDAVRNLLGGQVAPGSGPIWLDVIACTGEEQNIASCSHNGLGNHDCSHSEDAGVECSTTDKPVAVQVRLQGPLREYGTGRVEVFHDGQWGSICDDGWNIKNARVVCRQLGYLDAAQSLQGKPAVLFDPGPIWLDDVTCSGDEENIASCSHRGWGRHDCSHFEDAGVKCIKNANKPGSLRLQGPLSEDGEGRVEIFHDGQWGMICDKGWNFKNAKVTCRQLGYADAVRSLHYVQVPSSAGVVWLSNVNCDGAEQNITSCSHGSWGQHSCSYIENVGVECSTTVIEDKPVTLRLQGPLSANGTGRVEVLYNGKWGTICDDDWDINEARAVCQQLGYPDAIRALEGHQTPPGVGHIWLYGVGCTGIEQNLTSCSYSDWGKGDTWCTHEEDAGVECSTGENDYFHVFLLLNNNEYDVIITTNFQGQLENFHLKQKERMVKTKRSNRKESLAVSAVDADRRQKVNINGQSVVYLESTIEALLSLNVLIIRAP